MAATRSSLSPGSMTLHTDAINAHFSSSFGVLLFPCAANFWAQTMLISFPSGQGSAFVFLAKQRIIVALKASGATGAL